MNITDKNFFAKQSLSGLNNYPNKLTVVLNLNVS